MSSQTPFGRRGLGATAAAPGTFYSPPPKPPAPSEIGASPIIALLFGFQGRIPRQPYWMGQIGVFIACQMVIFASKSMRGRLADDPHAGGMIALSLVGSLTLLALMLALIWISIALVVKRWHDRGKSGVWALLGLVPILGWTWQFIECGFLEGTLGANRFRPSPKGIAGVTYATPEAEFPA